MPDSDPPDELKIAPLAGPLDASIRPPGSKSITNRALVCAALADGQSQLRGALDSEDTQVMIAGLRSLGLTIDLAEAGTTLHVSGCGGMWPASGANIFTANSGTTMRFLAAAAALGRGEFRLFGVERMHQRPIGDLVRALRQLGVTIDCLSPGDCPPVVIAADGLPGGRATIAGNISSQYLSGILMAAPYARTPIELAVEGVLVSKPYVQMTRRVIEQFGGELAASADYSQIRVSNNRQYVARQFEIEPDASAASYFLAAAAVVGGRVTVEGLNRSSLQGDVAFADCLEQMGAVVSESPDSITAEGRPLRGIDVDMNAISDTVPTLAVVALFADGPTRIRNVAHIRHKETDRITAVVTELRKIGADVDELPDGLVVRPKPPKPASIDTYNDHRMAMSFAIAGLRIPDIVIRDPGCTAKTYPGFFDDLQRVASSSRTSK